MTEENKDIQNQTESMSDVLDDAMEIKPNDLVEGEVLTIDSDKNVVVGLGGGQEGIIPVREISAERDANPEDIVEIGDKIEVVVLRDVKDKEQGGFILSKKRVDQRKVWEDLQEKADNDEVIEATVSKVVKGGVTVDLGVRGFVPASQLDTQFVNDLSQFEGNTYEFKIIEINPNDRQLILSRKVLLEVQEAQEREEALQNLEEGAVVTGTVVRLTNFGAFVNLGGIDGLVHVSEIAHERIDQPSDRLSKGDEVDVKVLGVDVERERVSLSIKETLPGPWSTVEEEFPAGSTVTGTVKRITDFGAFVELNPGVEGLVHISELSHKHVETPHEVVSVDEEVEVKVLSVDADRQRVSLSIKALQEAPATDNQQNEENKESKSHAKRSNKSQNVKQPSLRDNEEESAFTVGDQISNQLAGFFDNDDDNE